MPESTCLVCKRPLTCGSTRGLCVRCVNAAYRRIRARKTTWEQLEALGMALPACSDAVRREIAADLNRARAARRRALRASEENQR